MPSLGKSTTLKSETPVSSYESLAYHSWGTRLPTHVRAKGVTNSRILTLYYKTLVLQAFRRELASWRAIIQLNVVQSFHLIMDAMTQAQRYSTRDEKSDPSQRDIPSLTTEHLKIKQRLSPLLEVEDTLIRQLSPVSSRQKAPDHSRLSLKEVAVNSATSWKECFQKLMKSERDSFDSEAVVDWDDPNDPGRILHACSEDMIRLWNDPIIQQLLVKLKLRMREQAGLWVDPNKALSSCTHNST